MDTPTLTEPETIDDFTATLRSWYDSNFHGFQDAFDAAIAGLTPPTCFPDDPVYMNWQNATIDTLCTFFDDWFHWVPDLSTGLNYIQKFSWLYYENDAGLKFVTAGPGWLMTRYFVDIKGRWMDSPASRTLVKQWMDELGAKMDEYIIPPGGYRNFNQFFTRDLKKGRRKVTDLEDDALAVSPADAVVNMIDNNLSLDTRLPVKTRRIDVRSLLDNSPLAEHFIGGTALSCILMPDVYHHFHAPVTGTVVEANQDVIGHDDHALAHPDAVVKGGYFGISDFPGLLNQGNVGYGYDYSVFEHFRRGYLIIKTDHYGYVGMVPVGLNTIGSVVFQPDLKHIPDADPPKRITKGDKVGYFQYGGSLNILLFQRGVFSSVRIPQGQGIGTLSPVGATPAQFDF